MRQPYILAGKHKTQIVSVFDEKGTASSPSQSVKICLPWGVDSGPRGMASFLEKVLSLSMNGMHFLSRTLKANIPFERADELTNCKCLYQKFKNIYKSVQTTTTKITFFLSPGDTAAEHYNQNNDQDQKQ